MKLISLITPCFNEEENVNFFIKEVDKILIDSDLQYRFEVIFINDGSKDKTLDKLIELQKDYMYIKIINFSRNFGKEAALSAGIKHASGDAIVPIDVDLQHPLKIIRKMINLWEEGYEVILAKRINRSTDHPLQKFTANLFYKVHNFMSEIEIPPDVGDFRLMDKKVVKKLNQFSENRRFMKGLFAWIGFKTITIEYNVEPRLHGKSKFNGWKLWNFALEGITSFSIVPLKIWTYIGFLFSLVSFIYGIIIIFKTLVLGIDEPGYASIMVTILFMGGIQLISIGILGEYLGRTYIESKRRPPYIISDIFERKNYDI